MQVQKKISRKRLKAKVGKTMTVLIDEINGDEAIGRTMADAPEIDGKVYLPASDEMKIGDFVLAKILRTNDYDLFAS